MSDTNANANEQPDLTDTDPNVRVERLRNLFTFGDTIIVPDRGSITITVDSSTPGLSFTIHDADNNLLGDGVLSNLDFTVESFHINAQPDTPPKPNSEQPSE